jgi:type I restriction enzyme M protein
MTDDEALLEEEAEPELESAIPVDDRAPAGGLHVAAAGDTTVPDGFALDYISGNVVRETAKEQVRQRIARALFHEYGISVEDMERDFPIRGARSRRKVDIAIFSHGAAHVEASVRRIVVCKPEVQTGAKKVRTHEEAVKDLAELDELLRSIESAEWGLWTNGLEFFYLHKTKTRFEDRLEPIGDWPLADESQGTMDVASAATLRRATPEMLRIAFRRCHNFLVANAQMQKAQAFWQFLYLIFCKIHDEAAPREQRRFWAGATEQFSEKGRAEIRKRILPLFEEVKESYPGVFNKTDQIELSPRALAFMVSELSKYDLSNTSIDAKGAAYQEIVGNNLRGEKGQFFTPRGVVQMAVQMLDPKPGQRVLDPACGTGGFLVATLGHVYTQIKTELDYDSNSGTEDEAELVRTRLRSYAEGCVFGADVEQLLVRASQMNMVMAGDGRGHIFRVDSLDFPRGDFEALPDARRHLVDGSVDIVMTNPPFGSKIPITDPGILGRYELAHEWRRETDGSYRNTGKLKGSVNPEILFIERCIKWLKAGTGRMAIVLPNGLLSNAGDEYIRWWILYQCQVVASVDLPMETFIPEADVNIMTSVLFLRRRSQTEQLAIAQGANPEELVFMAVAEKVGYDRRGTMLYCRAPDGEEIVTQSRRTESVRIGTRVVTRELVRWEKEVDDDLPRIVRAFREFQSGQLTEPAEATVGR